MLGKPSLTNPRTPTQVEANPVKSAMEEEDERALELETLKSIFPELEIHKAEDAVIRGSFSVPASCEDDGGVEVHFVEDEKIKNSKKIRHLPTVELHFSLPEAYPASKPPIFQISSFWLSPDQIIQLNKSINSKWDGTPILFDIIDWLCDQGRFSFGVKEILVVEPSKWKLLLDYDVNGNQQEFDQQTYKCEICQYDKKGYKCQRLSVCHHVFCTDCLVEYFEVCIDQGYVSHVHCPTIGCENPQLDKHQLLELVGNDRVLRYERLVRKLRLESNPNSFSVCPRDTCQGLYEIKNADELLCVCPDCSMAYCRICKRTWHGKFQYCKMSKPKDSIIQAYIDGTDEEKIVLEREWGKKNMQHFVRDFLADVTFRRYLKESRTQKCPQCESPIERAMGCNKMICAVCSVPFCFLCGECLSRDSPYEHYQNPFSPCYRKLLTGTEIAAAVEDEDDIELE